MVERCLLCSLCGKRAWMVCESDEAKLCWDCDHKVHSANFLVEKHLRILLCRLCQSQTPWKACGPSLTPTSSLCHPCSVLDHNNIHDDEESDDHSDDDDDDDNDVPEEEEEEEEGENQVVPWSSPSPSPPSIDADTDISTTATASASATSTLPLKRFPHSHDSDDEIGCSSSEGLFRPLKQSRTLINQREAEPEQWHNHRC